MRNKFEQLIQNEILNKKAGKPAYIKVKVNHITDLKMVSKLYEAAQCGVEVDLLVRGNCSLMPEKAGLSDHMKVCGIIDRYLEHARIFIFANGGNELVYMGSADGGNELVYMGSADWMTRNLDNRIEVVTPVYDARIKEELKLIVDYGLADTSQGRLVDGSGENLPWKGLLETDLEPKRFRSQEALYAHYAAEMAGSEAPGALRLPSYRSPEHEDARQRLPSPGSPEVRPWFPRKRIPSREPGRGRERVQTRPFRRSRKKRQNRIKGWYRERWRVPGPGTQSPEGCLKALAVYSLFVIHLHR